MIYSVFASGSSGNCYFFSDNETSFFVDFGISLKKTQDLISQLGVNKNTIKGVFLTHFHPDHSLNVGLCAKSYKIPLYAPKIAVSMNKGKLNGFGLYNKDTIKILNGQSVKIGNFEITNYKSYHDSAGSVWYFIRHPQKTITLITDTGTFDKDMLDMANLSDVVFLESNYSEYLIDEGPYPAWLKRRIKSSNGHLSNEQAVSFINSLTTKKREYYLIHISTSNNSSKMIEDTYTLAIENKKIINDIHICQKGETYILKDNS